MFSLESAGPHQVQKLAKLDHPPTDLLSREAMSDWYGKNWNDRSNMWQHEQSWSSDG